MNSHHKIVYRHNVNNCFNFHLQRWHYGAARSAQKWAEQCQLLRHDTPKGRWIENYGACGQNIFVSTHKVPWYDTFKTYCDLVAYGISVTK